MTKDIHKSEFDDGTRDKLFIFQEYLKEWLPVFLKKNEIYWPNVNIFDFFAGPGTDPSGNKGTPLIIIDELEPYHSSIKLKNLNVDVYLNEYKKQKYDSLVDKISYIQQAEKPYKIRVDNLDFSDAFKKELTKMIAPSSANLLFLDQNGFKHIKEDVFGKIIHLKQTDFIFFISSSFLKRFKEEPEIVQHIKLPPDIVDKTPYTQIHRLILDYYKNLIPTEKEYYLGSFSLKKSSGVYGLIFGSAHVLGIEKFLKTCWAIDPERGEANFDIDEDNITPGQIDMFTNEVEKPKKVDIFERELIENILNRNIKNNKSLYLYTLQRGFLPKHTNKVLKQLVKEKKIAASNFILSSECCKKNAILTDIKIL